jgi:O-succinylbenzoate synthase
MTLREPFHTAHGIEDRRDVLLVRVTTTEGDGWGECVAPREPGYTSEYVDGATELLRRFLVPALLARRDVRPGDLAATLSAVAGHPMAKAALEMAVLDCALRAAGRSLASYLGATGTKVDSGVAVGLHPSIDALITTVGVYVEQGYRRVKLKIEPGWDEQPVAAVRAQHPDLAIHVDANGSYRLDQAGNLQRLDQYGLLMIEQPLPADDLLAHATLATKLATPICLDESITSTAAAATALHLGACRIVNVKPGRVGGYLDAKRLHDLCVAHDAPAWVGGMLETGLGRAANLALAALPGFTLPGDLSASDRYWTKDLTDPFVLDEGQLAVPRGPGIGVAPDPEVLARSTTWSEQLG